MDKHDRKTIISNVIRAWDMAEEAADEILDAQEEGMEDSPEICPNYLGAHDLGRGELVKALLPVMQAATHRLYD